MLRRLNEFGRWNGRIFDEAPRFADFDRTFEFVDELRRHFEPTWTDARAHRVQPTVNFTVYDTGSEFVLSADVPGFDQKDLSIEFVDGTLSVSGARKVEWPKEAVVHHRERESYKFARSFTLPSKIEVENVLADVEGGVLTIRLPKAAEVKPKRIEIRSSK